jgi:tetratricopeptide (TPR) repeat protein
MNKLIAASILIFLSGCYSVPNHIEPKVSYTLSEKHFENRSSPFAALSDEEKKEDWGKEFLIAENFAKELDLYRAVTNFKRAEFLLPSENLKRKQEIEYNIILSYFLGQKYPEAVNVFEKSSLPHVDRSFVAFEDLLLILYESYSELRDTEKTEKILELINQAFPETENKIKLSKMLKEGNFEEAANAYNDEKAIKQLSEQYLASKKSIPAAQALNAFIPGAGYLYVGQKRTAITSLLLNSLTIGASYYFFHKGNIPAGIIFASFEAGWYFGGIYGAGQEAKFYNERIYESQTAPLMHQKNLFPAMMLKYGF